MFKCKDLKDFIIDFNPNIKKQLIVYISINLNK